MKWHSRGDTKRDPEFVPSMSIFVQGAAQDGSMAPDTHQTWDASISDPVENKLLPGKH